VTVRVTSDRCQVFGREAGTAWIVWLTRSRVWLVWLPEPELYHQRLHRAIRVGHEAALTLVELSWLTRASAQTQAASGASGSANAAVSTTSIAS
jgi:hypothetical protein